MRLRTQAGSESNAEHPSDIRLGSRTGFRLGSESDPPGPPPDGVEVSPGKRHVRRWRRPHHLVNFAGRRERVRPRARGGHRPAQCPVFPSVFPVGAHWAPQWGPHWGATGKTLGFTGKSGRRSIHARASAHSPSAGRSARRARWQRYAQVLSRPILFRRRAARRRVTRTGAAPGPASLPSPYRRDLGALARRSSARWSRVRAWRSPGTSPAPISTSGRGALSHRACCPTSSAGCSSPPRRSPPSPCAPTLAPASAAGRAWSAPPRRRRSVVGPLGLGADGRGNPHKVHQGPGKAHG